MSKIVIIADTGVNHNGDMKLAKKMIEEAAAAGVDYIKFQTFKSEKLVTKNAKKAVYQVKKTGSDESQLEMLKKLEISQENFIVLKEYCEKKGIGFLSSAFDLSSIEFLATLDLDYWKIPSGEVTDFPCLMEIGKKGGRVLMSTGMCTDEEVGRAIKVLNDYGTSDITLLHCNTQYPTSYDEVNLSSMVSMRKQFCLETGFADHTDSIEISMAAAALGAKVIEKHFTLDKSMEGTDQSFSIDPSELKAMVKGIRRIERAIGHGGKAPAKSELENIITVRKSIVAATEINKGDIFTEENITCKRPGSGMSPMKWEEILGKTASRSYKEDELIKEDL
ncbi:N-acetylneuraminate synthase [Acetitomaculum ruminis DSM 5522]|uniref:N-acetylneuraminate synthase n=1 Tax=Acetitomaculum ruminis DSM 5522 TaxID=1120918 RepID=A0A1I1A928_9FIRM|nr:N-acetylneuraminate synthase [Acetitomaculum ruminis]SFB34417.1 N-acetylneuraminate synthase [Acetitomaculum ruminis DSM 5522]